MLRLLVRILKKFWFPILLIVLRLIGRKHDWAAKTHTVLKKAH